MPQGAQNAKATGVAGLFDAEVAAEAAVPAAASGVPPVWRASRGLSLGRAVGASDHGFIQWSRATRPRIQLAGNGPPVRLELEECGNDREAGGAVWLKHRTRPPVHVIGIDEVSRRKGQVYLTVVYDLERRVLLWVVDDRTEEAVRPFFTKEMGTRRCHTLRVICMDMWAPYANLVKEHAPQAQILFDRFHIVKHLNEAVEEVRRSEMRRLSTKEKVPFKRSRWLLLKNPWNLTGDQKERLSTLVRWNTPIVRAYYLKEAFQLFWYYKQPKRAKDHLEKWMHSAMRSRLEPFKKFVRMLRTHLDGILSWTKHRVSNGAVEGMNNKIKSISHRSFGFRSAENFIAAIYHCCARLPLPLER